MALALISHLEVRGAMSDSKARIPHSTAPVDKQINEYRYTQPPPNLTDKLC